MNVLRICLPKTAIHWLFFIFLFLSCGLIQAENAKDQLDAQSLKPYWQYSVRPGDTLIHLSKRYLANPENWRVLQNINLIGNPSRMLPGTILQIPVALLKQMPIAAEIIAVAGNVMVTLPDGKTKQAIVGEKLQIGSSVATAEKSKLNLKFADATVLSVEPLSVLNLDTLSMYSGGGMVDTKLKLQRGRVDVKANPKHDPGNQFQIITPTAVAAVRGTEFRVSAQDARVTQETLQGEVALNAGGKALDIKSGYGTMAAKDQPPIPPVKLPEAPILDSSAALLTRLPIAFQVKPHQSVFGWSGRIISNDVSEVIYSEQEIKSPEFKFDDLPDGRYVLRVLAQDEHGIQGYPSEHFFEVKARPFAPSPKFPVNDALVRLDDVILSWSTVTGISQYLIEVATDADFNRTVIKQVVKENHYQLPTLENTRYYWRVASVEMSNDATEKQGPFMLTQQFNYKVLPRKPDMTYVASSLDGDIVRLDLPALKEDLQYDVLVTEDEDHQQVIWRGAATTGELRLPNIPAGKKYLGLRLVESDGTVSPYAWRDIDIPEKKIDWRPLMLIPFIFAL